MESGKELFKSIPGYEGYYQVSNIGNVKSIKRVIKRGNDDFLVGERILKPALSHRGYYHAILCKDKNHKLYLIHQLVAMAFLNHNPNGMKLVVNHINFNKLDNRPKNLEIVTQRENTNKKHIKSTSEYTGVCWVKRRKKWASQIVINKKKILLGYFVNEYDAHLEYERKLNSINK